MRGLDVIFGARLLHLAAELPPLTNILLGLGDDGHGLGLDGGLVLGLAWLRAHVDSRASRVSSSRALPCPNVPPGEADSVGSTIMHFEGCSGAAFVPGAWLLPWQPWWYACAGAFWL